MWKLILKAAGVSAWWVGSGARVEQVHRSAGRKGSQSPSWHHRQSWTLHPDEERRSQSAQQDWKFLREGQCFSVPGGGEDQEGKEGDY